MNENRHLSGYIDIKSMLLEIDVYGPAEYTYNIKGGSDDLDDITSAAAFPSRLQQQREFRFEIDPTGLVVGDSLLLLKMFEEIKLANQTGGSILLLGETGVGKSHVAKLIHHSSNRAEKPFVSKKATLSGGDPNVQRGEWVGFSRNHGVSGIDAKGKIGIFEEANGGTLFIDEFVHLAREVQVTLLHLLEGGSFERIGGKTVNSDVRFIFAMNADPADAFSDGRLLHDLEHRIQHEITVPPLREHRGDILKLASYFLRVSDLRMDARSKFALLTYNWPGNIRELQKSMKRVEARLLLHERSLICPGDLGLPATHIRQVNVLNEKTCEEQLWTLAHKIMLLENPTQPSQKKTGEILCVKEAQASKKYKEFGL